MARTGTGGGQHDVGEQHVVIEGPQWAVIDRVGCAGRVGPPGVMDDVENQEQTRSDESRDHASAVGGNAATLDENEACDQEDGGQAVEAGIDDGEERQIHE